MSGPKGGGYAVVSAEELERRALQQADARYGRLRDAQHAVADSLALHGVHATKAPPRAAGDSRSVNARCDALESELVQLQERLTDVRVAKAIAAIPKVALDHAKKGFAAAGAPPHRTAEQQSGAVAAAEALIERMAQETGAEPSPAVLRKLGLVRDSGSPAQQRLALEDLRYALQLIRDGNRRSVRAAQQREAALAALDGCSGPEARRAYEALCRIRPGDPVPLNISQAQELAAQDRGQQDATFVQAAVVDVLQGLGYDVGDPMSVAVADRGALLELPGHPAHVAHVRTKDGQLRFSVVRVSGDRIDGPGDIAAEEESCQLFDELKQGLAEAGVAWLIDRHDPPGAVPVAWTSSQPTAVALRNAKRATRRPRTAEGEREADR
jgi:hypothetical protein